MSRVLIPDNILRTCCSVECYQVFLRRMISGYALCDLLLKSSEPPPQVGTKILCRHPVNQQKRAFATPSRVEPLLKVLAVFSVINVFVANIGLLFLTNLSWLLQLYWKDGQLSCCSYPSLSEIRERVKSSLRTLRQDHKRYLNPTPYKVSATLFMA